MPTSHLKLYALCGVIAPVLFALMVVLEGFLAHGYSQMTQQVSDLGAYTLYGSYALLQNLNFCVFGVLVIAFAIGLGKELSASKAITVTLILFGVAFFLLGFFPDEPMPWPGTAHYLIAWVGGFPLLFSELFSWRRLRSSSTDVNSGWAKYGSFSLVSLVLAVVSLILYVTFGQQGSPVAGLLQRVFLGVLGLWIEVMALKLLNRSKG